MPIYEYRCTKCGATFELLRRSSDSDDELRCPECGHQEVSKLFSAFATSSTAASTSSGSSCCGGGGSGFS